MGIADVREAPTRIKPVCFISFNLPNSPVGKTLLFLFYNRENTEAQVTCPKPPHPLWWPYQDSSAESRILRPGLLMLFYAHSKSILSYGTMNLSWDFKMRGSNAKEFCEITVTSRNFCLSLFSLWPALSLREFHCSENLLTDIWGMGSRSQGHRWHVGLN